MGFWEPLFFWIFALGAITSSIGVLAFRSPLYSALALIFDFFCFAGLYGLLSAHFLAVTQILVYAGAIMVLFVFIIMLLNLSDRELGARRFNLHHILAFLAGGAIFVFAVGSIGSLIDEQKVEDNRAASEASGDKEIRTESRVPGLYADVSEPAIRRDFHGKVSEWDEGTSTPADGKYRPFDPDRAFEVPPALREGKRAVGSEVRDREDRGARGNMFGTVEPISILLVNRFVIPFELTAVLLLAGIIGAVILAKKRL